MWQNANEVVVSHEHKFVYVVNRKAGSSTMQELLLRYFGASWSWCMHHTGQGAGCGFWGRCLSSCLSEALLREYYFFTFVRQPIDRFYSALKQSLVMYNLRGTSYEHMASVLRRLIEANEVWDNHLETQTHSLSTPVAYEPYAVPLDFIGRIETIEQDFPELIRRIEKRNGQPIPNARAVIEEALHVTNAGGELKESIMQLRDPKMDELVALAYAQDLLCFGYSANGRIET